MIDLDIEQTGPDVEQTRFAPTIGPDVEYKGIFLVFTSINHNFICRTSFGFNIFTPEKSKIKKLPTFREAYQSLLQALLEQLFCIGPNVA